MPVSTLNNPILKGLLGLAALRACRRPNMEVYSILDAAYCAIDELMLGDWGYEETADRLEALGIGTNILFDRP